MKKNVSSLNSSSYSSDRYTLGFTLEKTFPNELGLSCQK
jgi:hypothetical protein